VDGTSITDLLGAHEFIYRYKLVYSNIIADFKQGQRINKSAQILNLNLGENLDSEFTKHKM
jgi:hypothetical protein